MLTVHDLRKMGYTVRVRHERDLPLYSNHKYSKKLAEGHTTVAIIAPDDNLTSFGDAFCSVKDQYNRKRGVRIALGRALKQMGMCTK